MTPELEKRIRADAVISLTCEYETETIEGNCSAINPETDKATYDMIVAQLKSGNQWAWARVGVRASWSLFSGEDWLGCCSYASEEDFRAGGYYDDMVSEALTSLLDQVTCAQSDLDGSAI